MDILYNIEFIHGSFERDFFYINILQCISSMSFKNLRDLKMYMYAYMSVKLVCICKVYMQIYFM